MDAAWRCAASACQNQSPLITEVTIPGEREAYIELDSVEALIAAAQAGAVELHPWNCQPSRPEQPGRLVFDLDPAPDVDFAEVITAAKELRDLLDLLGLVSFCKTTGGKGLHVVAPVSADGIDWPAAKAFARDVCRVMAADAPTRFLTTMAKKERTGRIFLDYLRNDRTATAVAPLSPRYAGPRQLLRAPGRAGFDADHLEGGEDGARPGPVHDPNRPRSDAQAQGLDGLRRRRTIPGRGRGEARSGEGPPAMRIATFNVNGVNGVNTRLPNLLRWLEADRPDVVCLQELKADQGAFPLAALEAGLSQTPEWVAGGV